MSPYTITIRDPSIAIQILFNLFHPPDSFIQAPDFFVLPARLNFLHRLRERETHAIQALEEHQIRIAKLATIEVFSSFAALRFEDILEVGEEFGEAVGEVVLRARFGGFFLLFVVGAYGEGVVGVVGFVEEAVKGGEGELVDMVDCGGVFGFGRDEAKAGAEVKEDVGKLADG